jgi:hypothetical protein
MDLSHWNKSFPNTAIKSVTKQFYGKYLYKLKVYAKACGILRNVKPNVSIADHYKEKLEFHTAYTKFYQPGFWGHGRRSKWLEDADVGLLTELNNIKNNNANIHTRCEDPHISFYSSSESELFDVANQLSAWSPAIVELWTPDDQYVNALVRGNIIRKKATPYKYLIKIRDGKYSDISKTNIMNFLNNQGTEVQVTEGVRRQLTSKSPYLYNIYFYAKDQSIVTFLKIIEPQSVSAIHKIVVTK